MVSVTFSIEKLAPRRVREDGGRSLRSAALAAGRSRSVSVLPTFKRSTRAMAPPGPPRDGGVALAAEPHDGTGARRPRRPRAGPGRARGGLVLLVGQELRL